MNIKYLSLTLALILFTGCGGSSSSSKKNDGKGEIDLAQYYPEKSMTKTFLATERDGEDSERSHYDQIVEVVGQTIIFTEDTKEVRKVVFSDTNITITEDGEITSTYRHIDIGDTLFSEKFEQIVSTVAVGKVITDMAIECKLVNKVEQFEHGDNKYKGDLLKIECITEGKVTTEVKAELVDVVRDDVNGSHTIYDKSYVYLKKGLGLVARVNNDCVPNADLPYVNDKAKECTKEQYEHEFYLP